MIIFLFLFIDFNITEINYYGCSLACLEQHMQIQNEFLCQYFFTFNILSFLCYFCLVNILSIKKFRNIFFVTNFKSQYLRFTKQSLKFCKFIYFYFTYFFTKVVQFRNMLKKFRSNIQEKQQIFRAGSNWSIFNAWIF